MKKTNIIKSLKRAGFCMTPIMGIILSLASCADDHFTVNEKAQGHQTLWETIKSNPNLSEYADILQTLTHSQSETKTTDETYAHLFDGDQTFTVWAPVNGSFNYQYYKNLIQSGIRDSIYKVEKHLVLNNMTRFTHIINKSDSVKLELMNEKNAWLNYDNRTINGKHISQANIGTSNGVLHITEEPMTYQMNLYEYISSNPKLDSLRTFIKKYEKEEFNEWSSSKGPTVNGEVTWVDSVTYIDNSYINRMRAYLTSEDSNYVMIMPSNEAWSQVLAKTTDKFNYKSSYKNVVRSMSADNSTKQENEASEVRVSAALADSLKNLYSKDLFCRHLAFNANWQYEQVPITTIEDLAKVDSLKSTTGYKFKKTGTINKTNDVESTLEVDSYVDMFGNNDPIACSNGYAYIIDNWTLPSQLINPIEDYQIPISLLEFYNKLYCLDPVTKAITIECKNDTIDGIAVPDTTLRYNVLEISYKSTGSLTEFDFRLPAVMSCKYDIYLVLTYQNEYDKLNRFTVTLGQESKEGSKQIYTKLKNPNAAQDIDVDGNKLNDSYFRNHKPRMVERNGVMEPDYTDTICIAKDFKFDYCYYGLGGEAYPTLRIASSYKTKHTEYCTNKFWINSIILKAKEGDE